MKERMKRWLLTLCMTFALILLMGITVSAANGSVLLGNVRGEGSRYYYRGYRVFVTGYGRLEITGRTVSNGPVKVQLRSRDNKESSDGGHKFFTVNSSKNEFRYFGVMRGPYYIWVDSEEDFYIYAAQYLMSNYGAPTMGKAYALSTPNKWYTGVMPFNEQWSNPDWYKFKVPTNRTFYLYFQSLGTGYVELRLFGPGISSAGMALPMQNNSRVVDVDNWKNSWRIRNLPAGTYYLRIKRVTPSWKRTSLGYWVKWK